MALFDTDLPTIDTDTHAGSDTLAAALDERGWALVPGVLDAAACERLRARYDDNTRFRSRVVMQRHGFGRGEYKYFAYPLPDDVARWRERLYPRLVPVANAWHARLGLEPRFPQRHAEFIERCHAAGQMRPTPLLLRYREGDHNCLHQDLYGAHVFPLQAVFLLSRPGEDFEGGELVLTEQRPRMQSRVTVVPLRQGDAAVFAVNHRPVCGARGDYRVAMRHGVSPLRAGERFTLGIVFHDAA